LENQRKSRRHSIKLGAGLLILIVPVMLASFACSFPGVSDSGFRQTDVVQGVHSTLLAEQAATFQAQQTTSAGQALPSATPDNSMQETLQAQQAAMTAQAATIAAMAVITEPPATSIPIEPTATPPASSLVLEDWDMEYWLEMNSGCQDKEKLCWRINDDWDTHGGSLLNLTTTDLIRIDPNWEKPTLVLWNKRDIKTNAYVNAIVNGKAERLKIWTGSSGAWRTEAIDLSKYKGQEIRIQFSVEGNPGPKMQSWSKHTNRPSSQWFVQGVEILPTYTPAP
jgi:hypothetical protein